MKDPAAVPSSSVDYEVARSVDDYFDDLDTQYRRHFASMMQVAFLMTGSNAVAEDVVHDVFLRCAKRLPGLDDPGPYLRVSVVNACRQHHRREARRAGEPVVLATYDPSTADAVAVREALMLMSPKRRAALVLRYFEDLTHADIASALGCQTATARSLVRRGLSDLRGALND